MAHVRGPGALTKKGVPWDVCWTDENGRDRSKRFYDEKKAIKEAGRIEDQLRRGENTDPKAGRQTVQEIAEDWLATPQKARPATRAKYQRLLELHAFPALGPRRIGSITAADVGRFVESLYTTERGKPRAASGIERIMYPVRAAFAYALDEGYITRNPARKVHNPEAETLGQEDFEGVALTPGQVAAIAAECARRHEHGAAVVWFVALTGVRAGELARLDLSHLNTLRGYLTVPGTKSRRSRDRRVDYGSALTERLKPYLAAHPRASEPGAPLFFARDNNANADPHRRFDPGTFYKRVFKPAAKAVGIPRVRFHDLRHTAGSWWIEAGISLETVSARLGHADINFTRRTYIHQLHTRVEEDARKLDDWLTNQSGRPTNVVPLRRTAAA
jgi:integrase